LKNSPLNNRMDTLVSLTKEIFDFLFQGYTPKQKRDNLRFFHGLVVFSLVMIFIFSPSRSWARWIVIGFFALFITLYITLGNCWISLVETEYVSDNQDDEGVLIPILNLTGHPITDESKTLTTSIAYVYTISLMFLLTLRDCYGIY
jgi:hypothetical protein